MSFKRVFITAITLAPLLGTVACATSQDIDVSAKMPRNIHNAVIINPADGIDESEACQLIYDSAFHRSYLQNLIDHKQEPEATPLLSVQAIDFNISECDLQAREGYCAAFDEATSFYANLDQLPENVASDPDTYKAARIEELRHLTTWFDCPNAQPR